MFGNACDHLVYEFVDELSEALFDADESVAESFCETVACACGPIEKESEDDDEEEEEEEELDYYDDDKEEVTQEEVTVDEEEEWEYWDESQGDPPDDGLGEWEWESE